MLHNPIAIYCDNITLFTRISVHDLCVSFAKINRDANLKL